MKIVTVLGARPQFIKAALLSKELRKNHHEIIIHTGQHYDFEMSDIFFDEMKIPQPDYNLGIGSDTHAIQTAQMMMALEKVFISENPDSILVYGDTNSTLAAALTASKLNIPIAHVEAGPRMFDKTVPEEINRIVTDHVSTLLFAPTENSENNLHNEGLFDGVYLTGDIMFDNFRYFLKKANQKSKILEKLNLKDSKYILVTLHRARNTEVKKNLEIIINSILTISKEKTIVFPLHPRTENFLRKYMIFDKIISIPNIYVMRPVGYFDMLVLTENAEKIVTDSGGLQKEAYFAQIPCITLDSSTGWPETVEEGWNIIFKDATKKFSEAEDIINAIKFSNPPTTHENVFGNGNASKKICKILESSN